MKSWMLVLVMLASVLAVAACTGAAFFAADTPELRAASIALGGTLVQALVAVAGTLSVSRAATESANAERAAADRRHDQNRQLAEEDRAEARQRHSADRTLALRQDAYFELLSQLGLLMAAYSSLDPSPEGATELRIASTRFGSAAIRAQLVASPSTAKEISATGLWHTQRMLRAAGEAEVFGRLIARAAPPEHSDILRQFARQLAEWGRGAVDVNLTLLAELRNDLGLDGDVSPTRRHVNDNWGRFAELMEEQLLSHLPPEFRQ